MTSEQTTATVAIQQLCARYAHFLDQGRSDDAAELFAEDATWDGTASGIGRREGREAIRAGFAGGAHRYLHLTASHLVEVVDNDRAVGCEYMTATTTDDEGVVHTGISRLDDSYVRTPAGWRFASRRLVPLQSNRWSPDTTRFVSPRDLPPYPETGSTAGR